MKDSMDSTSRRSCFRLRSVCQSQTDSPCPKSQRTHPARERRSSRARERAERPAKRERRSAPPEQTHAENFYYQKQMQTKTPMVLVLQDDEEVHGDHRVVRQILPEGKPRPARPIS